ncbi:unnamed protein product [Meganyctiphanes norvegica]|uniref:WW domain-containing protein n=1 Tax=Meganyctiphanes norvegica TaxID=48144 RepID=A0AAV2PTW5_MEGNR
MVMHARKLPRISDGLHEKHQTHSYENARYSSKYRYSNHEKSRDSPSTNSLRSSSPDSRSQSPRCHKAANYYKVREKERERERENRERDRDRERDRERERHRERNHDRERERDRGEYSEYRDTREDSRSPKDRRREVRDRDRDRERERDGRGAHDRLNSVHKKEEKERQMRVGDWSEHVSSSGKKYYYNCRTEVSQWEKPAEWLEWERQRAKENSHRSHDKTSGRQEKHSSLGESYRDVRGDLRDGDHERTERDRRNAYHSEEVYDRRDRKYNQDGGVDMEISSGDSTPTSEHLHNRGNGGVPENSHKTKSGIAPVSLSTSGLVSSSGPITSHSNSVAGNGSGLQSKLRGGGLLNSSVPSSLPNMSGNSGVGMNCAVAGTSNSSTTTTTTTTTILTTSTSSSSLPPGPLSSSLPMAVPQILNSHPRLLALTKNNLEMDTSKSMNSNNTHSHDEVNLGHSKLEPLTISANSNNIGGGPPTPTHSENQDGIDIRKVGSPTSSSINSIQSLSASVGGSLAGLRPSVPALSPSLANYYKEPLIAHVQCWPAENLEKQAQRFGEEAHTVGSLIMTRVSAELKMARSLVRLAEIQATLHEQRILFLRAQKRDLEEMKAQNSFMSDT